MAHPLHGASWTLEIHNLRPLTPVFDRVDSIKALSLGVGLLLPLPPNSLGLGRSRGMQGEVARGNAPPTIDFVHRTQGRGARGPNQLKLKFNILDANFCQLSGAKPPTTGIASLKNAKILSKCLLLVGPCGDTQWTRSQSNHRPITTLLILLTQNQMLRLQGGHRAGTSLVKCGIGRIDFSRNDW